LFPSMLTQLLGSSIDLRIVDARRMEEGRPTRR
jgi:hypothetical protein